MHVFVLRNAINLLKDNLKQLCKLEENKVAKTNGKSSLHLPTIQQKYCTNPRLLLYENRQNQTHERLFLYFLWEVLFLSDPSLPHNHAQY